MDDAQHTALLKDLDEQDLRLRQLIKGVVRQVARSREVVRRKQLEANALATKLSELEVRN